MAKLSAEKWPGIQKERNGEKIEKLKKTLKETPGAIRMREYRARQKALKAAATEHLDLISENVRGANSESLPQRNAALENNNSLPLRIIVPVDVYQQYSSPVYDNSDLRSNLHTKAQDDHAENSVKNPGQAGQNRKEPISAANRMRAYYARQKEKRTATPKNPPKSGASRAREFRSRQKALRTASIQNSDLKARNPPKSGAVRVKESRAKQKTLKTASIQDSDLTARNPSKSGAVQVRDYRTRQNALKTASIQHNDLITENVSVANRESLPQPNTVVENINNSLTAFDPLYQANSPPLNKEARNLPKSGAVRVRECRARQKALKTASIQNSDLLTENMYAGKWGSLLRPKTMRITFPVDVSQPDSSSLQDNSNGLSEVHEEAQNIQQLNAAKERTQAWTIRTAPKSSANRQREYRTIKRKSLKMGAKNKMSTKKKRGCGWTEEAMDQALTAIKNGMPLYRASNKFNIPRRTLRNHVATGRSSKKLGCTSVLTPEQETELCFRIARLADAGMPLTSQLLRRSVVTFCIELDTPHRFKNDIAGRKWLHLFLKRHPEIYERMTETANLARDTNLNRQTVCDYFDRLKQLLLDYELIDKPERIFNIGERVCYITLPYQHQVYASDESESATIVGCGNAIGNSIPPMILLKSERYKSDNLPIGTAVEMTEEVRMTADIFSKWVYHFAKFKPPGFVLLIFDGTKSHLDVNISKVADENDILLLCLPSNCTQELQPMDKAVFKSFEFYWNEEITKYWVKNLESSTIRFGEIFFKVWVKSMTPENIISGFRETGIFPFDFTIIPEVTFAPSSSSEDPVPDIYNCDVKIEIKEETLEDDWNSE